MTIPGASPDAALSVAQLTQMAKLTLEGAFPRVWIAGEVTNLTRHRNGHWYFTLRDAEAQLSCVVWARDTRGIPAVPDEGMQVLALGKLSVFPGRGQMQCMVTRMEAEGEGLWKKAFEATRASLERDGLLDAARKRALPFLPRTVAVVTSLDGAALHDILAVLGRRNPAVSVVVVPAQVQGEGAPASLRAALDRVVRWGGAEVCIIGRGGGSREDLWAFNDEGLARALAAMPMPTVSAVGHEVDVSITDLVADVRAPTPSVAAEMVAPPLAALQEAVAAAGRRLVGGLERRGALARRELARRAAELPVRARRAVERRQARVARLGDRLVQGATRGVERRQARVATAGAALQALSPLRTLERGFAVAVDEAGRTLASVGAFAPGMAFTLRVRDGEVAAEVR